MQPQNQPQTRPHLPAHTAAPLQTPVRKAALHSFDAQVPFSSANPHALATILDAAQTRSIIASRDIFDINGIKLWARDAPVSGALQRKLLDRQLRNPLESCLTAADGITTPGLASALRDLLQRDLPLNVLLRPAGDRLLQEVNHLPLHPVAQLLLTAGQASRPESFDHAVQAMALAGALCLGQGQGGSIAELRLAMLGGLLHDLGEMYIDPRYGEADADRTLDFTSYQQLVVHPHVGRLLLTQLTNYPSSLARAVAEHHERCDGTGYPQGLRREAMSPLGRLLAVTEAALGALRDGAQPLERASVALRVIPGEYDLVWAGALAKAARSEPLPPAAADPTLLQQRLARLDGALQQAQQTANALASAATVGTSLPFREAVALGQHLLGRLRAGWYASGLWSSADLSLQDAAEVAAVDAELGFRLRSIERAVLLRAGELAGAEADGIAALCKALTTLPEPAGRGASVGVRP